MKKLIKTGRDLEYMRRFLSGLNVDKIRGQVNEEGKMSKISMRSGNYVEFVKLIGNYESLDHFILEEENAPNVITDRMFEHFTKNSEETLKIYLGNLIRNELSGKHVSRRYYVKFSGNRLENKIIDVGSRDHYIAKIMDEAISEYKIDCLRNGVFPHISKVHSEEDTKQQGYMLALSASTERQVKDIARLTYSSHLLDDLLDGQRDITKIFPEFPVGLLKLNPSIFESDKEFKIKSAKEQGDNLVRDNFGLEGLKRIRHNTKGGFFAGEEMWEEVFYGLSPSEATLKVMFEIPSNDNHHSIERLFNYSLAGALIQNSKSRKEQEKYMTKFRDYFVSRISDIPAGWELSRSHPILTWPAVHVGLEPFFSLDGTFDSRVAVLHDLFYAPMLYCHDREEERSKEGFSILYGKEFCNSKGYVEDKYLIKLVDIFEENINHIRDNNWEKHAAQRKAVFKGFSGKISESSPRVADRYKQFFKKKINF